MALENNNKSRFLFLISKAPFAGRLSVVNLAIKKPVYARFTALLLPVYHKLLHWKSLLLEKSVIATATLKNRLTIFWAKENTRLVVPYFISLALTAISINSISRGIENHEVWRIITAGIGGSFFLGVAVLMVVRLFKKNRKVGRKGNV